MNENWTRWITASIIKNFRDNLSLEVFVEGEERDTKRYTSFVEVRIGGPNYGELSKGYYEVVAVVNILVQSAISKTDLYVHQRNIGAVVAEYNDLPIYELGDGDALLFCLSVLDARDAVTTRNYGQVGEMLVQQATVEAQFIGTIQV